jgi:LEA14-like dessication related protein
MKERKMMKKILVLIAMLVLINGIAAALIFLDVKMMQTPSTTIKIDLVELNSDEAVITAEVNITNPNSFNLITKDFEVVINAEKEIARFSIEGGSIPSRGNKSFTATAFICFDSENISVLTAKITGTVGMTLLGFVEKTLPIDINIVTSLEKTLKEFATPVIHVSASFHELTQEKITVKGSFNVYNPNPFRIHVRNIAVTLTTEKNEKVGNLTIKGGEISSKSSKVFNGTGEILVQVLNAKLLRFNISGIAGAKIAGVNKSISFQVYAQITPPDVEEVLTPHIPTHAMIRGNYKITLRELIDETIFEIYNPNKISFLAENITITLYRVDNNEEYHLASCSLGGGVIKAENTTCFEGELIIPYKKLIPPTGGRFIPDWLKVTLRADIFLPGVNYSIPIGLSGYQDLRFLR